MPEKPKLLSDKELAEVVAELTNVREVDWVVPRPTTHQKLTYVCGLDRLTPDAVVYRYASTLNDSFATLILPPDVFRAGLGRKGSVRIVVEPWDQVS